MRSGRARSPPEQTIMHDDLNNVPGWRQLHCCDHLALETNVRLVSGKLASHDWRRSALNNCAFSIEATHDIDMH